MLPSCAAPALPAGFPLCRRLLPALLHFGEPPSAAAAAGGAPAAAAAAAGRVEVLKYVRFCIRRLACEDTAVHNLAVALLSMDAEQVGDALVRLLRLQNLHLVKSLKPLCP